MLAGRWHHLTMTNTKFRSSVVVMQHRNFGCNAEVIGIRQAGSRHIFQSIVSLDGG
jgi:hypothetical protein